MKDLPRNVTLDRWSSFRTRCVAEHAVQVARSEELDEVMHRCRRSGLGLTLLGGGTNVVLRDRVQGCVVRIASRGLVFDDHGEHVRVSAEAGESWHGLVRACVGRGLAGIENLALIPGDVGAAPIQNIGAYGMELSERLVEVRVIDRASGARTTMTRADCRFGYRGSAFKVELRDRCFITGITLELSRRFRPELGYPDVAREIARMGVHPTLASVCEAVVRIRRRKLPDPRHVGNAGSFFKNPVLDAARLARVRHALPGIAERTTPEGIRVPAAALIDACGMKGARRGPVGVWQRQPLVLVNFGGARGADVLALADEVRARVLAAFGVTLELEPTVLGMDR